MRYLYSPGHGFTYEWEVTEMELKALADEADAAGLHAEIISYGDLKVSDKPIIGRMTNIVEGGDGLEVEDDDDEPDPNALCDATGMMPGGFPVSCARKASVCDGNHACSTWRGLARWAGDLREDG